MFTNILKKVYLRNNNINQKEKKRLIIKTRFVNDKTGFLI